MIARLAVLVALAVVLWVVDDLIGWGHFATIVAISAAAGYEAGRRRRAGR